MACWFDQRFRNSRGRSEDSDSIAELAGGFAELTMDRSHLPGHTVEMISAAGIGPDPSKSKSVSWAVRRRNYPLRNLFQIFAESQGVPLADLVFTFHGRVLNPLLATPSTAGFSSRDKNTIFVSRAHVDAVAIDALVALAEVEVRPVTPGAIDPNAKGSDLRNLFRFDGMRLLQQIVFDYAGMTAVVSCAMVSRQWLALSCKHGVTWQLNQGSRVETDMGRYTKLLKQAFAQTRGTMHPCRRAAMLNVLSLHKDKWKRVALDRRVHLGGFMGKGVRIGRVAILRSRSESFQSQLDGVMHHRLQFFELLKAKQQQLKQQQQTQHGKNAFPPASTKPTPTTTAAAATTITTTTPITTPSPPPHDGSSPFEIVPATTPAQKQASIALYRRYFGSDLHYVYPVVVGAAVVGDLFDFRGCVTWIAQDSDAAVAAKVKASKGKAEAKKDGKAKRPRPIFSYVVGSGYDVKDPDEKNPHEKNPHEKNPHAAITWRMHSRAGRPVMVEVLFMATWPESRGEGAASQLVTALETVAVTHGCEFLYVEVANDHPLAARFWSCKHSLRPVQPLLTEANGRNSSNRVVAMKVAADWCYNLLQARRTPDPTSNVIAQVLELNMFCKSQELSRTLKQLSKQISDEKQMDRVSELCQKMTSIRKELAKAEDSVRQPFKWLVDMAASTDTHWKLALGMKEAFGKYLLRQYTEATEGWLIKCYEGHNTLEIIHAHDTVPGTATVMELAPKWPYSLLQAQRVPGSEGEVLVQVPTPVCRDGFEWLVDETKSTETHWKLATGSKQAFGGRLLHSYDEEKEGWVVKAYEGHETLAVSRIKNIHNRVAMRLAADWHAEGMVAATLTPGGALVAQVPARVCREGRGMQWFIDFAASTATHWKLAAGAKAELGDWLLAPYNEATQGWVAKRQKGKIVLEGVLPSLSLSPEWHEFARNHCLRFVDTRQFVKRIQTTAHSPTVTAHSPTTTARSPTATAHSPTATAHSPTVIPD